MKIIREDRHSCLKMKREPYETGSFGFGLTKVMEKVWMYDSSFKIRQIEHEFFVIIK